MNENKKKDISFEEAMKDLEKIVEELNNGDLDLEKAINAYEKGVVLKNICEEKLKNAKERVEKIKPDDLEKV
ncbi:MAG: exodeoxyribonuclease VII small subunit [Rickettsiales bacterium]|nr:exodeoxyribonuclease VII small subunit [Rickettsiales bacterium]|tara:strand:+ start:305 stop:520 length:216 start_codon:yes stop_codon:yes gene_type:complete